MRFGPVILAAALMLASGALAKTRNMPHKARNDAPPAAAAPVGDVNGAWTIEATASVGECPAIIPDNLTIAENKIASAPGDATAPWGYVEEDGTIVARFTGEGGRVARFHGQLRGGKGSGAWSSSTDMCGGSWRAWRSGAERAAQ
jgi:hypothetical protein